MKNIKDSCAVTYIQNMIKTCYTNPFRMFQRCFKCTWPVLGATQRCSTMLSGMLCGTKWYLAGTSWGYVALGAARRYVLRPKVVLDGT